MRDAKLLAGSARLDSTLTLLQGLRYQPCYCEENAWWLCGEPEVARADAYVVFITNRFGHCPVARQRAAPPDQVIWWDYHVVVLDAARLIWDLDTRLGLPLPAADWLTGSFPFIDHLSAVLRPTFRLIPCADYRRDFASDRGHMRDADGRWHHPPPPWPSIGSGMNLHRYRHPSADEPGELLDWQGLRQRVG
jgi:hypothetical protein